MNREPEHWNTRLPESLHAWVIAPLRLEQFHEADVPATKWRGYDASGALCYYRHRFTLWEESFDEDELPCERRILHEDLEAWLCIDGRWLRRVSRLGAAGYCETIEEKPLEVVPASAIPRL